MKRFLFCLLFFGFISLSFNACRSSNADVDVQQRINDLFKKDMAGAALNATVDSGVATITGQCKGAGCTTDIVDKVKKIDGVKDVQTHIIEQP